MKLEKNILKQLLLLFFVLFFFLTNAQNPFIENKGQFPKSVISKTNLPSGALFIEEAKLTYAFYNGKQLADIHDGLAENNSVDAHAYSVSFLNANTTERYSLKGESKFFENYYLGEKSTWASNVKSFKTQTQHTIYNGIDLYFYIDNDHLKYELHLAKNSNEKAIKFRYDGVNSIALSNGNLFVKTSVNSIMEYRPYAYQIIEGIEVEVDCSYKLNKKTVSFSFPDDYNRNYPLVIDPVLEFSTYSGSTTDNFGYTATYDNFGFLYAGSTSFGVGYPTTLGAYQINYANAAGGTDVAITKYDTTGTTRIYSTYLGGSLDELPHSMIVNSANELFVYGTTASADFPVTSAAYQTAFNGGIGFSPSGIGVSFPNGSDIFVSRLSADGGSLLASTFIGGTGNDGLNTAPQLKYNYADEVRGEIDIDKNNNIYIATCTKSTDFPTVNSFQMSSNGNQEGCIVKMDNQLTTIIWSSYLGGVNDDAIYSLALDKNDDIYVTGGTNSDNFPTTTNAYQTAYQDSIKADAFITKITSDGNQILSSSYFGTNQYDQSYFVEIGSANSVYLFGQTKVSGTQLVNNATYSIAGGGQFVAVFDADLNTIIRSTVVGTGKGTPDISPTAFLVDVCDKIYLAGWGSNLGGPLSTLNLPVSVNAYQPTTDGNDIYLMVLDDALSTISYATYFGGSQSAEHVDGGTSRFDKKGIIYQSVCAGCGGNSDFPIEPNPGAVSTTNNSSNCNNGVFKFNFDFPMVIADFNAPWVGCDTSISFQNLSSSNTTVSYQWDFGDGTNTTNPNPTHIYSNSGTFEVSLIATAPGACNTSDTIVKQVYILSNSSDTILGVVKCPNEQIQIGLLPVNDPTITYLWSPTNNLSSLNVSNPFTDINTSQQYQLLISNGSCTDTLLQSIIVSNLQLDAGADTSFCSTPVTLQASYSGGSSLLWSSTSNFTDTLSLTADLTVASIATFYVKLTDGYCEKIDSISVFPNNNLQLSTAVNSTFCNDSSLISATFSADVSVVLWSSTINFTDTLGLSDTAYVFNSGTFYIQVTQGVCQQIDSVIVVSESIVIELLANDICEGDSVLIEVNNLNPSIPITTYTWEGFSDTTDFILGYPDTSAWYFVEVVNENLCVLNDSVFVNVYPYPVVDSIWISDSLIYSGLSVSVYIQTNTSTDSIVLYPTESSWYFFDVENQYGCFVKDSIWLNVITIICSDESIIIPTAFTPFTSIGKNDIYRIKEIDQGIIDEFLLEIFNRYGQKVFSTTSVNKGWDGTFKQEPLSPQVFDFYLKMKCYGGDVFFHKGNITLIR
jgi:gliding motility-associated-like protein